MKKENNIEQIKAIGEKWRDIWESTNMTMQQYNEFYCECVINEIDFYDVIIYLNNYYGLK